MIRSHFIINTLHGPRPRVDLYDGYEDDVNCENLPYMSH